MAPMADPRNGSTKPPASGSAGAYTIDVGNFSNRLKVFYTHWREHKPDLWGASDSIAIATPPPSDDIRYLKSSTLHIWFPKKAAVLESVKRSAKDAVDADIIIHVKQKSDDVSALIDGLLNAIHSESEKPIIGRIQREEPEGKLMESWLEKLGGSNVQLSDITAGFSELFAIKDASELNCVRKAAYLTSTVMKNFVVPKLEQTIDEEKKVSHSVLMEETEKAIHDPVKLKVKLKSENVDICYPPILQSGGKFDLRPSASSNDDNLYYESASVILCALGARYGSYCSNIARTFLIDAHAKQSKAYEVLLKAHTAAINALKPGNRLSSAYKAAVTVVENEAPELLPNLSKTAGTGIGLEFRESGLTLNARNDHMLNPGMVFNVSLGFQNLQSQTNNPKTETFSLLLADTIIVVSEKPPEILTSICSKAVKDIAYSFNEDDEEQPKMESETTIAESVLSKASLNKHDISKEELRRQHQAELARQKNEETARRLAGGGSVAGNARGPMKTSSEMMTYKNVSDLPYFKEFMIQVDQKNEAVLIPIFDSIVPFHVSTIKSVTSNQDNRTSTVRIIFNVPGTPFAPHDANTLKHQGAIFLKEANFRSKDTRHSSEVVQLIKTLRRQVASRESERAERATLVTQEKLQLAGNRMKPIRLLDLSIRPAFPGRGRKLTGALEAHNNGFRYSTSKIDERVDIMYGNIKHAFFQPAEREMITLLHFRLHNHIMVGNKKTLDIQFYVEVMDVVQTLGGGRRSALDPDEIEEEQRERDRKNKINLEFQNFVNKVHDHWGQQQFRDLDLEFDQPLRELGFHGVPHKASSFIVPSSSCLVELIETPPLVITLSEIEIVNLERVGLGQKSFDMAIVFKDFSKDVFRIDSIPSSSLDGVKEWLDTTDIKYYKSRLNLNWRPILKTIIDDPEKFIEDGGWEFLNLEASDSDSDASQESDHGYAPSDVDVDVESESDDEASDGESLVESEDDEEEDSEEDSEEDKGKTWEELEKEATRADRERGGESDSEEDRKWRKAKALGKSRIPDRRDSKGAPPKRAKLR
ncbi:hypothetical protein M5K25_014012 [Dendrobium thyrsiflorum]|uniref:FACT complex subunit n=1 Tax=Dendrobium thyrsiflorum TaxID=117978 RepID=A0ABD0V1P4_DENTH